MGKGKGSFERRVVRLAKNTVLFEFSGISFYRLNFFVKKVNKKLNFKLYVLYNDLNLFKLISNKGCVFKYYVKFLKNN